MFSNFEIFIFRIWNFELKKLANTRSKKYPSIQQKYSYNNCDVYQAHTQVMFVGNVRVA